MNKLFKLLALTVCVLSGYISYAQSSMTVSGNVKDSEGLPIIGAVVMIEGQTSTGVITDADGNYTGGIYSFQMAGQTYFTTYEELMESYDSHTGPNDIDGQIQLPYYNATYVKTRIEETKEALLETDSNGRFKTVRFADNSLTYSLNTETVTRNDILQLIDKIEIFEDKTAICTNFSVCFISAFDNMFFNF